MERAYNRNGTSEVKNDLPKKNIAVITADMRYFFEHCKNNLQDDERGILISRYDSLIGRIFYRVDFLNDKTIHRNIVDLILCEINTRIKRDEVQKIVSL